MPAGNNQQNAANASEVQTFWVSPLEPIPAQSIALPAGDQIGIRVMTPAVMCFRTTPEYNEARFIDAIQKATAATLTEIPILAGKVVFEDDTCKRLKCEIAENTKIEVRVKRLPHLNVKELDARHWPPYMFPRSDISMLGPSTALDIFSFAVQANLFDGGVIILLLMNHILLDGYSIGDLEDAYAHHFADAFDGKEHTPSGLYPAAALDKSTVYGSSNARPILEWKDWRMAPQLDLKPDEALAAFMARLQRLTLTFWYMSPEKQSQLRADSQAPGQKLSMHICFSSWLWRVFARARGLSPNTISRNYTTTETRGRVGGVHRHYVGNALVYGRAKATASELRTLDTAVLGDRINKSVAWWTPERIREHWGSINDHVEKDSISNLQPNMDRDFGTDVEFSNVSNTPYYKLYWGRGLEVARYRSADIAFADGYVIMFPKFKNGGMEISVYAEQNTLKKLATDPKFRQYVEYQTASSAEVDEAMKKCQVGKSSL